MNTGEHQAIILGDGEDQDERSTERDSEDRVRALDEDRDTSVERDLSGRAGRDVGDRWTAIQAQFVDDPRQAVGAAHQLVGEQIQRIADGFANERSELEKQWSKGKDVSTEDLRLCLQHYREFFSKLAPSVNGMKKQSA